MIHRIQHHRYLLFLGILLFCAALAGCISSISSSGITPVPRPGTPMPTPTSNVPPTRVLRPTSTAVICINPTQTPTPTITPTATQVTVIAPEEGAEAYRLDPWDEDDALRVLEEAAAVPIAEEYQDMRDFYRLSLLEEVWLDNPHLREDPELVKLAAELKWLGMSYEPTYGLLHDYAVEPVRLMLERHLNDGSITIEDFQDRERWEANEAAQAMGWMIVSDLHESYHLLGTSSPGWVVKIYAGRGWGFFAITTGANGQYSVTALRPHWTRQWWSDESFDITNLNANGIDEIAVTYDGWGTGMSHFCDKGLRLYEWDGETFVDLMADELRFFANTDYGYCLDITFPVDPRGGQKIQAGTKLNTLCPEVPYEEPVTFAWDGQGFRREAASPPTLSMKYPNRCTIDWAVKAEAENDTAVAVLAAAVENWPVEANADWGPAGQDYMRLKLATWNIRRGQYEEGLSLLRQVRDHPAAPDYAMPACVAAAFLENYESHGWYRAVQTVDQLYTEGDLCGPGGCNVEKMRQDWGFAEREWEIDYGYHFTNDFLSFDALALEMKQVSLDSQEELTAWLEAKQLHPVWVAEGNLDGRMGIDWLVVTEDKREYGSYYYLRAFLQRGNQLAHAEIDRYFYYDENETTPLENIFKLQSIRPDADQPPVNIFQTREGLYAFRLVWVNDQVQVEMDLNTWDINRNIEEDLRIKLLDWKIDGRQLIVQYDGKEAVYAWDATQGKLAPTGYAPELQEQRVGEAEQALYFDKDPAGAAETLEALLSERVLENYNWVFSADYTNPPRLRPYMMYLLGLAYEQSGDAERAARAYWQLWRDFPASPYSLAAQSKLEHR